MGFTPEQITEMQKDLTQKMIELKILDATHKEANRVITNLKACLYYHTGKGVKERHRAYYVKTNPDAIRYNNGERRPNAKKTQCITQLTETVNAPLPRTQKQEQCLSQLTETINEPPKRYVKFGF